MKKSELQQLIKEEIQELTFGQKGIDPKNNPKGDLIGKINNLLDDAERTMGAKEVAGVINVLYQRYRKHL
jgi:hypothetical protein